MRRRRKAVPELVDAAALPEFHDDYSQPLAVRLKAWEGWMETYEAWAAGRDAWYAAQGLEVPPEVAYEAPIPLMPFDGTDV